MKRNINLYLNDILDSIVLIDKSISRLSKAEFINNIDIQDATIRRLEIIGEAVKNIPLNLRKKYPNIEWKQIAGTRDVLIHAYFGVNLEKIWKVIKKDIPKLKKQISKIFQDLESEKD